MQNFKIFFEEYINISEISESILKSSIDSFNIDKYKSELQINLISNISISEYILDEAQNLILMLKFLKMIL